MKKNNIRAAFLVLASGCASHAPLTLWTAEHEPHIQLTADNNLVANHKEVGRLEESSGMLVVLGNPISLNTVAKKTGDHTIDISIGGMDTIHVAVTADNHVLFGGVSAGSLEGSDWSDGGWLRFEALAVATLFVERPR